MMNYRLMAALAFVTAWAALCVPAGAQQEHEFIDGKWQATSQPAAGTSQAHLAQVRRYVHLSQHTAAVGSAKTFLKAFPADSLAEEVLLLAGESEMARDRYWQGYGYFEKQLTQFPAGKYSERAILREYEIGDAFLNGKKRVVAGFLRLPAQEEGLDIMLRVVEHAPGSVLAERAMMRIADHHFAKANYPEAVESYDRYMTLFRNAPRMPYAMEQGARSALLGYRGKNFDDTMLVDAEQRYRIFRERYPAEAAKANVEDTLKHIRLCRAQKLYDTAEFYKRTGHPLAQAHYYRQAASQYPQSPYGLKAREDLIRMGDLKPNAPLSEPQTQPLSRPAPATMAAGPGETFAPTTAPTTGPSHRSPTTQPASGPTPLEELAPLPLGPEAVNQTTTEPASDPQKTAAQPQAATTTAPTTGEHQ